MRLLVFNLATDADDPLLGFATHWLNRLAARCEHIDVITMRAGRLAVAPNVRVFSVGKERGFSEARRAAEFYRLLAGLLARSRCDACFAHMMPLFAVMGAPLLKLRGIPITLWYTHRQISRQLEMAVSVCDRIVTADASSFPLPTDKLRPIGHGIDCAFYDPQSAPAAEWRVVRPGMTQTQELVALRAGSIVQVARLMPIKHQETLVRALVDVTDARAVLVGGTPPGMDGQYEHRLRNLAHGLNLGGRLVFVGDQPAESVREFYRRASVAVNLSPPGLFDKSALESMAMQVPTIVASPAFDPLLGEHVDRLRVAAPDDMRGLAERLRALFALSEAERSAIGAGLRQRVLAAHDLDGLIERLINVLRTGEP